MNHYQPSAATAQPSYWVRFEPLGDRLRRRSSRTETGCLVWQGPLHNGYGHVTRPGTGRTGLVHRVAYELWVGPIPEGMSLDHLCRNRACIEPSHLEPVSTKTNLLRGVGFAADNSRKTHCKNGHLFGGSNLRYQSTPQGTFRVCRTCERAAGMRYYGRQRA